MKFVAVAAIVTALTLNRHYSPRMRIMQFQNIAKLTETKATNIIKTIYGWHSF